MLLEMTEDEIALWNVIHEFWLRNNASFGFLSDEWDKKQIGKKQRKLTSSLLRRDAVPERRKSWASDPAHFTGHKTSRLDLFCKNYGSSGPEIFEHPHWYYMGYLPLFVGHFDLPASIEEEFRRDVERPMGRDIYDLGQKYRSIAKKAGLTKRQAEEFHKLALDCGFDARSCRSIRDAVFKHLKPDR